MYSILKNKQILVIYLFLTATCLIAFWQVMQCDFIDYDDHVYITKNIHIRDGITKQAIQWAFTTVDAANWHPLTWMSHMLDVQLFGFNPHWHHLTNLLFHIANVLLLFFVLQRMTKTLWQSAFVAALFALHPLHVESVAWVAERKDVLSTFFWMLTLVAYSYYAERPRLKSYLAVIAFFALGLMAKSMLVTLPFVLLLLDYWPLERFVKSKPAPAIRTELNSPVSAHKRKRKTGKRTSQVTVEFEKPATHEFQWAVRPLVLEKIPLFVLTIFSCAATYISQNESGAVAPIEIITPGMRIANAFVSYFIYITKTIWPDNLAVYYPHPGFLPLWQVLMAVPFLVAVTFAAIWAGKRSPYLPVGWLWFTGTLVPVIGIVQTGGQAVADRYTYIPSIGLFIMAAWGIPELLRNWRFRKEALFTMWALTLSCLFIVTWHQVGYWRNSITLFDHALKVTNQNYLIHQNRGSTYLKLGNQRLAIEDYDRAIEINPKYQEAYSNRGVAYVQLGNFSQAILDFNKAIEINHEDPDAYYNRGVAHYKLGNFSQAILDFNKAIEIKHDYVSAYYNRGAVYGKIGNHNLAIDDFKTAAKLNDEDAKDLLKSQGINW